MQNVLEVTFNGLSTGMIYALIALGFVLIFKSTGILNFAQGELAMVGAFLCFTFAGILDVPYAAAFVVSLVLAAVFGGVVELVFFRRMVGEHMFSTVMVTVGLASVITCLAGLLWGHDVYSLRSPFSSSGRRLKSTSLT